MSFSKKFFLYLIVALGLVPIFSQDSILKDERTITIILPKKTQKKIISPTTQIPDREKSVDALKKTINALFKFYEQENIITFMNHISNNFISLDNSRNKLNYSQFARSIKDDFIVFDGIKHQVFVKSLQIQADGKKSKVELRWNRRAILTTKNNEEWILKNKSSILIFQYNKTWKLVLTQGDTLFGQSNVVGNVTITQGTLNGKKITGKEKIGVVNTGDDTSDKTSTVEKKLTAVDDGSWTGGQKVNLKTGVISSYSFGDSIKKGEEVGFIADNPGDLFMLTTGGGDNTYDASYVGKVISNIAGVNLLTPITLKSINLGVNPNILVVTFEKK